MTERLLAAEAALKQRLDTVAATLGVSIPPGASAALTLDHLARSVRVADDPHQVWLLHIGITGAFPAPADVERLVRELLLSTPATALLRVLDGTIAAGSRSFAALRTITIASDEVVVDANFCARWEHNTGIQRVVRHTVPEWESDLDKSYRLVIWSDDSSAYVAPTERQTDRVLHWSDRRFAAGGDRTLTNGQLSRQEIVVPWNSVLLLAEVPLDGVLSALAGLARFSPNRVAAIGYDAIPLISADTLPDAESERFAHYLSVVKHIDLVVGISESASDEFRGFVRTLPSQGLPGPRVEAVSLATEVGRHAREAVAASPVPVGGRPTVICVGSHEPRKNQEAVLFAAEMLFDEGLDFRLVFVGGGSRQVTHRFDSRVAQLRKAGRSVESHRRLGDDDLWRLFAEARFSVFVSLHEGFGLPVAESLALGTPVLTSDFGSLDEVASEGGCVQVDPRDDDQIVRAMRSMLTDDALIDRLGTEIERQTPKTWMTYADQLWSAVTGART